MGKIINKMNIRHIKFTGLAYVSLGLYASGIGLGMFGRNRIKFSSDFTYNKYHFGVFNMFASGAGLMLAAKTKTPALFGVFFLSSIANLSMPSFYEGILDMNNEPLTTDT